MKSLRHSVAWLVILWSMAALHAQPLILPEESPAATVSQRIGITQVTVSYHRPSVNGREIWGKLVPYGFNYLGFGSSRTAPWRAGANENTTITFEHEVNIGGKPIKAGSYGLFMALTPEGAVTVILSNDYRSWGSFFYDESRDALRTEVKWEDAPAHEQLTYEFTKVTKTSADLALLWERKRIPIAISVNTDAAVVASLTDELRGSKGFQAQAWVDACQYLLANKLDLDLALRWADVALTAPFVAERNFETLSTKAEILERLGRGAEATPLMDEAIKLGNVMQLHQYGRKLIAEKNASRALEVFKLNAQRHPDVWPVNYGLARGLAATGDFPAAVQALMKAQTQVPEGDSLNTNAIKANLEKLKRNEPID